MTDEEGNLVTHPLLMIFLESMSGTHTYFPESCGKNWPFQTSQENRNRDGSHLEDIPERSFLPCSLAVPVRSGGGVPTELPLLVRGCHSHSLLPLVKHLIPVLLPLSEQ